jgi:thioesterase domain-containing protein
LLERVPSRSPIIEIQKGTDSKRPFFFLHGDFNGGGFYCLNLARGLGADQPFYALQPHGLDEGPVPPSIELMAESHLKALRSVQPNGPYLLGGYCNGGIVAFEMARRLQAEGEKVDLLALVCTSANNVRFRLLETIINGLSRVERQTPEARLNRFVKMRQRAVRVEALGGYYKTRIGELWRMSRSARAASLRQMRNNAAANLFRAIKKTFESDVTPSWQPDSTDDRRKRVGDAYANILLGYVEKPYSGRIVVLWPDELQRDPNDPTAGWGKVAAQVESHKVPGGHITCLTSNIHQLAATLQASIQATQNGSELR